MVGTETRLLSLSLDSGGRPAGPRGPGGPAGTARSSAGLTSDGRRASLGDARSDRAPTRPRPRSVAIVSNGCQTWRRPGTGARGDAGDRGWRASAGPGSALLGRVGQEGIELGSLLGFGLGLGAAIAVAAVTDGGERVELALLLVLAGDGRRQREAGGLLVDGPRPVLEERVVLGLAEALDGLAGERLEGSPPLALLERGDVLRRAGPGRDQLADDDVLLEADQVVAGAVDRGLREHPRRLLEGGRREERRGVERRLGHAEEHGLCRRRLAALRQDLVVGLLEVEAVDELRRELLEVARLVDPDLLEHLPDDDLDVLVVDRDALAAVHPLDLAHEVALDGVLAPGVEVLLRVDRPVGDGIAGTDLGAVLNQQLRAVGDRVLALDHVLGTDDDAQLGPGQEALHGCQGVAGARPREDLVGLDEVAWGGEELGAVRELDGGVEGLAARHLDLATRLAVDDLDDAVDVADLGLALGDTGLEQLLDARQALRDVLAGDAAGVERPHGELRARLADGLGGDDADRLADADHLTRRQVPPVAHPADAVA